jgi:cyclopropane-fatty-acyl-phospholipid synthase
VLLLDKMLASVIKTGRLEVIDAGGQHHVYEGAPGVRVTVRLKDPALHHKLFLNPELHAGEAYMDGQLVVEQGSIRDFLTLFVENRGGFRGHPLQKLVRGTAKKFKRLVQRNSVAKSRNNVE